MQITVNLQIKNMHFNYSDLTKKLSTKQHRLIVSRTIARSDCHSHQEHSEQTH